MSIAGSGVRVHADFPNEIHENILKQIVSQFALIGTHSQPLLYGALIVAIKKTSVFWPVFVPFMCIR